MTWVAWRAFRVPALVTIAILVALAILTAITGVHLHNLYGTYQTELKSCHANNTDCGGLAQIFTRHYHHLYQYLGTILVATPAVIGIFWGAPLIARELETGTYRLAWTQGVTRDRWLGTKLAVVGFASVATAGLLSLMVTWWSSPVDAINQNRFSAEIFSVRGIVPIGYAAFAFVLGVTLGLLIRRTLPAMAVGLVAYVGVHLAVIGAIRPHLIPANHMSLPLSAASNFGFTSSASGSVTFMASGFNVPNSLVVSGRLADKAEHERIAAVRPHPLPADLESSDARTTRKRADPADRVQRLHLATVDAVPRGRGLHSGQPLLAAAGGRDRPLPGGSPAPRWRLLVVAAPPPALGATILPVDLDDKGG
jgi:hypothetical protein